MKKALASSLAMVVGFSIACGSGNSSDKGGGTARVTIAGQTYTVSNLKLTLDTTDGGFFRIDGDDAAHPDEDCLPGLGGGLALYGDVPSGLASVADLAGRELPFEFSGDGDDANLCFVGSNGLLGVDTGTVRFGEVSGSTVAFSFSGSFTKYDGNGGEDSAKIHATGEGIAHLDAN